MVIDTMVFVYALLAVEEFREQAAAVLARADEIHVPDSFRAEFVNVIWQWIAHRDVPLETGIEVLRDGEALISDATPAWLLWERALELSARHGHPAYDTLFVALAERLGTRVVSFGGRLCEAFPEIVVAPDRYLGE